MTPFHELLTEICESRQMLHKELAYRLEINPSYLSAITAGRKGMPSEALMRKLQKILQLNDIETQALEDSIKFSQMKYHMPKKADASFYKLVWDVFNSSEHLTPTQISAIRGVLKICTREITITEERKKD